MVDQLQPAIHRWRDPTLWGIGVVDWVSGPSHLVAATSTVWPYADAALKVSDEELFGAGVPWDKRMAWLKLHGLWVEGAESQMAARFARLGEVSFSNAPEGSDTMCKRLADVMSMEG